MRDFLHRAFDKTYLVLAPAVLLTYFVPIRMRVGPIMIVPFVVLWLIAVFIRGEKCERIFTGKFLAFFVPLVLFFLLRSILTGLNEYDKVPLLRHIQYSGLVCIYLYVFHYTVSRLKINELRFLNVIILISLAYGCFASASMDIGAYRNMGVVAGTARETMMDTVERLEYASSGVSNYGDVYAMTFIIVGLMAVVRYCKMQWKSFYVALSCLFFYGIYKAAFTTGLAVALATVALVLFLRACNVKGRRFKVLLSLYAFCFVVAVAFPTILSPFTGLAKALAIVFEPISHEYSLRLYSIAEASSGYKDTYAVQRAQLYWNSLDAFVHRPLFGFRLNQILFHSDMNMTFRGHSYFFDSLAMGGIVLGGLLLVGIHKFTQYLKYAYERAGVSADLLDGWFGATGAIFIVACINQIDMFNLMIGYSFVVPSIPFFNYRYHFVHNPAGWRMNFR
ncbi:MAG: hypothetical protein K6G91_09315 [Kiritimatiellae bacterium]|nr:hypothetical protein [Kiritimatiellia bacterium]